MKIISNAVELRSSLGIVKDYMSEGLVEDGITPDTNYDLILDMVENDPVLSSAFEIVVDNVVENGYSFKPTDGRVTKRVEEANKLFDSLNFKAVLKNIVFQMVYYGDAYMELRRTDGVNVDELWPLETTEIELSYDKHGEVHAAIQKPSFVDGDDKGNLVVFPVGNFIHFRQKWIGSSVYSRNPLKPILTPYATKKYANSYLARIFKNFPPRLLYVLKNTSKEQTKNFIEMLKEAKNQPHKDMVALGDVDLQQNGVFSFDNGFGMILNYLREEILMITRVPKLWLGIPDGSNRSSSDASIKGFGTKVKALQKIINDHVNKDLLPALELTGVEFSMDPASILEEKLVLENAKQLKDLGYDGQTITDYLYENGVVLRPGAEINAVDAEIVEEDINVNEEGTRTTELNENGVSEDGAKKQEQLDARGAN